MSCQEVSGHLLQDELWLIVYQIGLVKHPRYSRAMDPPLPSAHPDHQQVICVFPLAFEKHIKAPVYHCYWNNPMQEQRGALTPADSMPSCTCVLCRGILTQAPGSVAESADGI